MTQTTTRRTELDLCRICACLMVLVIHTGSALFHFYPTSGSAFPALMAVSTFVRASVPVFFMITGAVFLSRPVLDIPRLLKKNVLRLVLLFFFWSLLYALGSRLAAGEFGGAYEFFMDVAGGHYHMWFLPAMLMCYLFLPPVWSALHGERISAGYLLFLFFTVTLLCANCNLTPDPTYILNRLTLHFNMSYLGYLGYAVWGWWLSTKSFSRRWLWLAPLIFVLCAAVTTAGNLWYSSYKGMADGWLFSYFSLPNFILSGAMFCFFLALREHDFKHRQAIVYLSDCTLGVYLMHPLGINILERFGLGLSGDYPLLSLFVFVTVLALGCFALTALAKRIPGIRKLL